MLKQVIRDFAASSPSRAAVVAEFPFGSLVRADDDGPDFYVVAWGDGGEMVRVVPFPVSFEMSGEKYLEAHAQSVAVCAHCARKHKVRTS
jgi:hypothetical protein